MSLVNAIVRSLPEPDVLVVIAVPVTSFVSAAIPDLTLRPVTAPLASIESTINTPFGVYSSSSTIILLSSTVSPTA